jgi:hypothetical protein
MGLFDKVKKTTIESRRYEEKLYEVALEEVEAGEVRKGLYAKALSKADGDKEKADGIYLKLRVQSIMDDIESEQIDRRDAERAYKTLQEINAKQVVEVEATDGKLTLENAKKKVKNSSYSVSRAFGADSYFVDNKNTGSNVYQTFDLEELHNWIDTHV